jgi:hypothetical protein
MGAHFLLLRFPIIGFVKLGLRESRPLWKKKRKPISKVGRCSSIKVDDREDFVGAKVRVFRERAFMKRHLGFTLCHYFHVPALSDRRLDHHLSLCWRKDLGYWVDKEAEAKDAEV